MTGAVQQRDARQQLLAGAIPKLDGWIRSHHPLLVADMLMDRRVERVAPLDHRGIIMRMRDRDAGDTAQQAYDLDRGIIDEADAVPHYVAVRRTHQQRALGN